jgi:hypothetical protein
MISVRAIVFDTEPNTASGPKFMRGPMPPSGPWPMREPRNLRAGLGC